MCISLGSLGTRKSRVSLACANAVSVLVGLSRDARCDGDDFFLDMRGMPRETELVYIGVVKDENGKYLQNAIVRAEIAIEMESGVRFLKYDSVTDVLGRYRTRNLGRTIIAFDLEIDPTKVTLAVIKEGYKVKRRYLRSRRNQTRLIEVDFLMAKEPPT